MYRLRLWPKKGKDTPDLPQETSRNPTPPNPPAQANTDPDPSERPPIPSFPDGVKVLHDCPDATVDICFVHGLTGDRESTWTANGQSAPWPKTLLPPKLNKARILTYGYDAYVVRRSVASANRLIDHATNLLAKLTTNRDLNNASSRPLIFVAHSLGGLVCKEAILLSRNNPEPHLRGIFNCVKGIIFMGTPHKGSWMANWAKIPASTLGLVKHINKSLLQILETDDQFLELIRVRFLAMLREQREGGRPLEVTCFLEELPLPIAGQVVFKESAILEGYTSITIHANHSNMVKFASAEEDGFQMLLGELVRWESQVGQILSQTAQSCLRSLAFPQMHNRSYDIGGAVEGTCRWLLEHKTYRSWAACDRGLLWIKGKPGSGKSTLLKYALDNHGTRDSDLVLSFFFHGRGNELQRTPLGLFRSLLHQILGQAPYALRDLVDTFEKRRKEFGKPGEEWQWHEEELRRFFKSSLLNVLETHLVWLFVDALDECGKDDAVKLIDLFKSLLKSLPSRSIGVGQFRICFSCRHYPILDLDSMFEICLEDENGEDISTFVDNQLGTFRARTTISALITKRASGVFMWARFVVKKVLDLERDGFGLKEIKAAVDSIPSDLEELYRRLIQDMGPASLKLIRWICFARRPLSIDELRWAMVIEVDCPHRSLHECQSAEDIPDSARMKRQVQTLSRGLAEVTHAEVVQFIHQSVKDFFVEKGLSALDGSGTSTESAIRAHFRLSRICIRYLAMDEIGRAKSYNDTDFPFLHYATKSWVMHTAHCDARSVPQGDLLTLFAWPSNALVDLWVRVYQKIDRWSEYCPPDGTNLVHVVSRYGFFGLLTAIVQRADGVIICIDAKDGYNRTPLSWAAENGHEAVVQLLLSTGKIRVDARDVHFRTPLSWATENGHGAVVQLLLSTGKVGVDARDGEGRTPLSWAAANGHEAVVKLLLDTGKVDVDARDGGGRTPLFRAAEKGHEVVVKLLLSTGKVDVDARDKYGQTLLSRAAEKEQEAVVKLLLSTGKVDYDTRDRDGRTPLSVAAENGLEAVVQLLLSTGKVNVDAKDSDGLTPLSLAAVNGLEAVVQLLLSTGKADVNTKDWYSRTPLSRAAENGHEAVVKLLLGTGKVDIDARDRYGQTPLLRAAEKGHEVVVKLLLSTGKVDVDTKDGYGQTPLSWAAEKGHEAVVKLLLGTGKIDCDARHSKSGRTPLSRAAENGHEAVVKLLLSTGKVDVDARDKYGQTPLSRAAENRHEAVVKLLKSVK